MTPCQRLTQTLFDFLDADLDSMGKHRVESHLKECPHCSKWFNQIKRQKEFLKKLKPIRTQDHFLILLRERIRREMAGKTRHAVGSNGFSWSRAVVFALALLTLAVTARVLDKHLMKRSAATGIVSASADKGLPLKVASAPVHYVIDDFRSSNEQLSMKKEPILQAVNDTLQKSDAVLNASANASKPDASKDTNFEELRSRLTPVNF